MTRMDRMSGVSRFPIRPESCSTLAMIPEDDTYVIPPRATEAMVDQPRSIPAITPGEKLRTRSSAAVDAWTRTVVSSSLAVYSSPSMNSSRMRPISAPISTKPSVVTSGSIPPFPNASPAVR